MSERDDGGPAFPFLSVEVVEGRPVMGEHTSGMTLRDYFAAKAMQAMIAKSNGQDTTGGAKGVPLVAKYAYEYADAMLAERAK